ncbi:uncharacterized protein PV06_05215 [Exophiala oligosperma]|uniref:MYND-type domain-containing protein n=1 Tax=Exophiala oligosperma TaxID=215243 RepID=A0A0D2DNT5_9EURO|nr:uncharacterized protein PV06_05215 [Exophiala oligosperma]KIW44185.1 hypothetical protein PV06_05215 [Exophiala oligosperma]
MEATEDSTAAAPSGSSSGSSCAQCGASTSKTCAGCRSANEFLQGADKTYYCSKECQQAHWTTHKATCERARRHQTMYQGGDLLQALWTVLRTETFPTTIDRVEVDGDTITFWETCNGTAPPFPHHLFQDDKVKQAVLDYGACSDALFHMRKLVQELFSAISSETTEVNYRVKERRLSVKCYNRHRGRSEYAIVGSQFWFVTGGSPAGGDFSDERVFSHSVFVTALKGDGEGFVIDLASRQYGHSDNIIPVNKYLAERVSNVISKNPFGTHDETIGSVDEQNSMYFERVQFGALRMHRLLRTWLAENNLTLSGLVALDKASFQTKLAVLREYATRGLQATAKESAECCALFPRLLKAKDPNEKARIAQQRLDILEASGITVDLMQPENRSWFGC